ncbi:MAG: DUF177 domain-containing protein [Candidatus Aminicenantales bacterium]
MLILVNKLPDEGFVISRDFEFSSNELVEESAVFLLPVHTEVKVKKIGEEVFIKGNLHTSLNLICSRCMMPYKFQVDLNFDLVYLPEELDALKEELEESDMENFFYRDQRIDLREVVLEQLNLSFPLKPLCAEDCQGICPVCGKNQKIGRCDCSVEEKDPRLQKLKSLIKDR